MEQPESLFQFFKTSNDDRLVKLANLLIQFSPIEDKYLNKQTMIDDIYISLVNFYFVHCDWDELEQLQDLAELVNSYDADDFAKELYFDTIAGLKRSAYGHDSLIQNIRSYTARTEINQIANLIKNNLIDMINEYKQLVMDREKTRL